MPQEHGDCVTCTGGNPPAEFAADRPVGDAHVGVRFGHFGVFDIFLYDSKVSNRAFEAMAGPDGWVAMYDMNDEGRKFVCPDITTGTHAAFTIKHGEVRVAAKARVDA